MISNINFGCASRPQPAFGMAFKNVETEVALGGETVRAVDRYYTSSGSDRLSETNGREWQRIEIIEQFSKAMNRLLNNINVTSSSNNEGVALSSAIRADAAIRYLLPGESHETELATELKARGLSYGGSRLTIDNPVTGPILDSGLFSQEEREAIANRLLYGLEIELASAAPSRVRSIAEGLAELPYTITPEVELIIHAALQRKLNQPTETREHFARLAQNGPENETEAQKAARETIQQLWRRG